MNDLDDKIFIVVALTIIAVVSAFIFKQEALSVINNVVSGLLGMAVGRNLR